MSSTPRAKPMVAKEGGTPRAAPAAKKDGAGEKKPKAKKPKGSATTAPISLGMPMNKPAELSEEAAKQDLENLQKKYGALVVSFNNQQAELAAAQKEIFFLQEQNERLEGQVGGTFSADDNTKQLQKQLSDTMQACAAHISRVARTAWRFRHSALRRPPQPRAPRPKREQRRGPAAAHVLLWPRPGTGHAADAAAAARAVRGRSSSR